MYNINKKEGIMYKIGMIGTSEIASKFAHAVKYDNRCELEIIYSRDIATASKFQQAHNINQATASLDSLINSAVDILYIATPNKIHYQQVKLALENNINVIVEKPITIHNAEILELYNLAEKHGLILIEAVKTMAMNTYQEMKNKLDLIGNIESFELNIMRQYENYPSSNKNMANIYKKSMDGGVLSDLGSYALYPLVDLIGTDFALSVDKIKEDYLDVETEIHVKLSTAEINGEINLSMKNQGRNISKITGNKGYIEIDSLSQFNFVKFYDLNEQLLFEIKRKHQHLMEDEIIHMVNLVAQEKICSDIYTDDLAINVQILMDKIRSN